MRGSRPPFPLVWFSLEGFELIYLNTQAQGLEADHFLPCLCPMDPPSARKGPYAESSALMEILNSCSPLSESQMEEVQY